jgi:HEAT repeats/PBS lyase HEAT-like repeat
MSSVEPKPRSHTCPAKPDGLSRKIYMLWGVCICTLVILALFCWLVVVPVMEVHSAIGRLKSGATKAMRGWAKRPSPAAYWVVTSDEAPWELASKEGVVPLGGPERAARAVSLYLRVPDNLAPDKSVALVLAGACCNDASPLVPQIICFLEDDDRNVRLASVVVLGRIGDARAVEHLVPLLAGGGKHPLCWQAIEALGRIGDPRAVDHLLPLLAGGGKHPLCWWAIEALGRTGDPRAVDHLLPLLKDTAPENIRAAAVTALGRLQDRRGIKAVIATLRDHSLWVRRSAVLAVGRIGGLRAIEPLKAATNDSDPLVSRSAKEALKKIRAAQKLEK